MKYSETLHDLSKGFAPVSALVLLAGLGWPHLSVGAESDAVQRALSDIQAGKYMAAATALRQAAADDDPQAMFYLGNLAFNGTGVAQSSADAIRWYCRAALGGSTEARQRLATVDLGSWSQERDAAGWQNASKERLKPKPPKPAPAAPPAATEEPGAPVTVYSETAPGSETEVFPTYWPWYWYVPGPPPRPPHARGSHRHRPWNRGRDEVRPGHPGKDGGRREAQRPPAAFGGSVPPLWHRRGGQMP
jgi:hypothetical protein